jgi:hypothetical protein
VNGTVDPSFSRAHRPAPLRDQRRNERPLRSLVGRVWWAAEAPQDAGVPPTSPESAASQARSGGLTGTLGERAQTRQQERQICRESWSLF